MITSETTHAELARTIDDLSQWLSIVETGLGGMLDVSSYAPTIEEEQEGSTSDLEDDTQNFEQSSDSAGQGSSDRPLRQTLAAGG